MADYQKQAEKVGTWKRQDNTIEVAEQAHLQEPADKLVAAEMSKKFTATQVEYIDLLQRVNAAMPRNWRARRGNGRHRGIGPGHRQLGTREQQRRRPQQRRERLCCCRSRPLARR